jgi:hypothetical protein
MTLALKFDKVFPSKWEKIRNLTAQKAHPHDVVIAGGAIRDHLLGIPAKDLDLFVLDIAAEEANQRFGSVLSNYGVARNVHKTINGISCDIIFLDCEKTAQEVLNRFDLGICKVAWDGQSFLISEDFLRDARDRKITELNFDFVGDHRNRIITKLAPQGFTWRDARVSDVYEKAEALLPGLRAIGSAEAARMIQAIERAI